MPPWRAVIFRTRTPFPVPTADMFGAQGSGVTNTIITKVTPPLITWKCRPFVRNATSGATAQRLIKPIVFAGTPLTKIIPAESQTALVIAESATDNMTGNERGRPDIGEMSMLGGNTREAERFELWAP